MLDELSPAVAVVLLVVLAFELCKDLVFIHLMLDSLRERRHRRELEERALEAELSRAKRATTPARPDQTPAMPRRAPN
jgi:hypothetical protein